MINIRLRISDDYSNFSKKELKRKEEKKRENRPEFA